MSLHSCLDPATGLAAFSFVVPAGWQVQSSVRWNPQSPMNPVTPSAMALAPDNSAWMTLLPNGVFSWVDGGRLREGSMEFGAPAWCPRPAAEVLVNAVFPSARPGIVDLRLMQVDRELAPPWPSQMIQPVAAGDDSIRATLEYTVQGQARREVVSMVAHVADPTPMPTMWGVELLRYWCTFPGVSVGAILDHWDEQVTSVEAIRASFRVEPGWINAIASMTPRSGPSPQQQQSWFADQQAAHRQQVAMGDQLIQQGQAQSKAIEDIYDRDGW